MKTSRLPLLMALFLSLAGLYCALPTCAQDPPELAQGLNAEATYQTGDFDLVDMASGRLNLHIPLIVDHSQRGQLNFTYSITATSTAAFTAVQDQTYGGVFWWTPSTFIDPKLSTEGLVLGQGHNCFYDHDFHVYVCADSASESDGSVHPMALSSVTGTLESIDGSGIQAGTGNNPCPNFVKDKNGIEVQGCLTPGYQHYTIISDPNGNQITTTYAPPGTPWPDVNDYSVTDTVGRAWSWTATGDYTGCPVTPVVAYLWTAPAPASVGNGTRAFKFCYVNQSITTNLPATLGAGSTTHQWSGTPEFLNAVVLPDGTRWQFLYDNTEGDLTTVFLPTGGYISYTWASTFWNNNSAGYEQILRTLASRTVSDGTTSHTWYYNWANGGYTVTDPLNNDTVYVGDKQVVTQVKYYAGSATGGNLLKTESKGYQTLDDPYLDDMNSVAMPPEILTSITTTWPTNQVSQASQTYQVNPSTYDFTFTDTNYSNNTVHNALYGLVRSHTSDDYGSGVPGRALSTTNTVYLYQQNSSYLSANLLNLPFQQTVMDGTTQMAQTTYLYDENNGSPSGIHGNLTSVTRWLNTGGTSPKTQYVYNTNGMRVKMADPIDPSIGNPTQYTYDGTGAFLSQVQYPNTGVPHLELFSFDSNTGLLSHFTDQNGNRTDYLYECMLRPYSITYPDGGQEGVTYNYSGGTQCTGITPLSNVLTYTGASHTKAIDPSHTFAQTSLTDGLGRLTHTQLTSDPEGVDYTDTSYDADGRVGSVSNPYRSTSDSTYGVTQYQLYDTLNRIRTIVEQDNSTLTTSYSGNCTTITDEALRSRRSCADGLQRLVEVDDYSAPTAAATSGSGPATVNGGEQYSAGTSGTAGTGWVQIGGSEKRVFIRCPCSFLGDYWDYDSGEFYLTVNGVTAVYYYGEGDDSTTVAAGLAAAANSTPGFPATASASGSTVYLTANTVGAGTNYSLSTSSATDDPYTFGGPSFWLYAASGSTLTGGTDGTPPAYDSGSVWASVNVSGAPQVSATYGQGDNASTVASRLASNINANGSFPVSASVSGATITLTAKAVGYATNYSVSSGSTTDQPSTFSQPSFSVSVGSLSGGSDAGGALTASTFYQYDALSNLIRVDQKNGDSNSADWRTRTFTYDSLSRLLCAANPEVAIATCPNPDNGLYTAGTMRYAYDANSNLISKISPQANQTGSATTTISYCYDALNRLTSKAYTSQSCPQSSPAATYGYDGIAPAGCTPSLSAANPKPHRTGMCDGVGTEAWSYDLMGRSATDQRKTNGVIMSTSYAYNYDGSVKSITYPSNRTVTYTPSPAARPVSAVDTTSNINYATSALYTPAGAVRSMSNGTLLIHQYFNSRLQPCRFAVDTSGGPASCMDSSTGNIMDFTYNFGPGADNGNVLGITNNRVGASGRSLTASYDMLNRIKTAYTSSWSEQYGIDLWGNLTSISAMPNKPAGEYLSQGVSNQNRFVGMSYDAAGNLLNDGSTSYTFDAENRIGTAGTATYTYDGDGKRVAKSTGGSVYKIYWYGMGSDPLAETDGTGSTTNTGFNEYVFFNGNRIARRNSAGNVFFYFADHLGTSREIVQSGQTSPCYDADFYPFGKEQTVYANTCPQNYKFTGKERDETGLDDFGARYYSSQYSRFITVDWAVKASPVPYADFGDPQSLNLYGYVKNNPLSYADPDGHCDWCDNAFDFSFGIVRGAASSVSFGAMGSPQSTDTDASRLGQIVGSGLVGAVGEITSDVGKGAVVVGLAGGVPTGGSSTVVVVAGAGATALGTAAEAGAAANLAKIVGAPMQAGFSQNAKDAARANAGGKCEYCGKETVPGQKSQKGVTPPGNEGQTDHYDPVSKGGSNGPSNAVHACRDCNQAKSNTSPQDTRWQLPRKKDDNN